MSSPKDIIVPFIIGGCVISGVKFAATHLDNPALAAIIGGVPTGLVSIYFLTSDKTLRYSQNYFFVTLSLLCAIVTFYMLTKHTQLHKNVSLLIAIITWATLVSIRYMIAQRK